MTELPPDVRDRAARAAQLADAGGSWIPEWDSFHDENREYWRAIVDAVAEVLAAADAQRNAQLAAEVEVAHAYRAEWEVLRARVDLLSAALTGLCDVYHARPLNELLDGEETVSEDDGPKFAAWANARAVLSATPTARYVVQNRGAAWAVHDNERHMDISLYTDEQFTQEFCQRMNTTPTGSET